MRVATWQSNAGPRQSHQKMREQPGRSISAGTGRDAAHASSPAVSRASQRVIPAPFCAFGAPKGSPRSLLANWRIKRVIPVPFGADGVTSGPNRTGLTRLGFHRAQTGGASWCLGGRPTSKQPVNPARNRRYHREEHILHRWISHAKLDQRIRRREPDLSILRRWQLAQGRDDEFRRASDICKGAGDAFVAFSGIRGRITAKCDQSWNGRRCFRAAATQRPHGKALDLGHGVVHREDQSLHHPRPQRGIHLRPILRHWDGPPRHVPSRALLLNDPRKVGYPQVACCCVANLGVGVIERRDEGRDDARGQSRRGLVRMMEGKDKTLHR